ncbi:MAG: glycosyltransferase [Spirulina sp. SIO3F2]|nr:glycosyltransferase [Spirulina sp. SIO3F2]
MRCKICEAKSTHFAQAKILKKYDVEYFQCSQCGFVQTEHPYWLTEAYEIPITKSDYGLVARNVGFAQLTLEIITKFLDVRGRFLDYGAGYGVFAHLMRYLNLDFSSYDRYCDNILAPESVVTELTGVYDLITAFEVFEHWVDPIAELSQLFQHSSNLLFSTELLPSNNPKPGEWHYYIPHEGQHIAFYTPKSLQIIAERFGLKVYTTQRLGHFFTDQPLPSNMDTLIPWQRYEPQNIFPALQQQLLQAAQAQQSAQKSSAKPELKILVDGVFFQLYKTGIARVWSSVLREWAGTEFSQCITVLDRANTAPKYEGLTYRTINPYSYNNWQGDRTYLQQICDEEGATLFISSYYTTPLETPSVFMAYDMIPEVLDGTLDEPMWQAKHSAIRHASACIGISENTIRDLQEHFPAQAELPATIAHCGVDPLFAPATGAEIEQFRHHYGIQKPYFLLVAPSTGYKNAQLFFQAFAQLPSRAGFDVVCTSKQGWLDPQLRQFVPGTTIHPLQLSDAELRLAYAGAIALVYPSRYEGFGMPVIEALACGCPVITSPVSSLPEVGGDAVLYVPPDDLQGMMDALAEIQKPSLRRSLRVAGLQQAAKFTWDNTAAKVQQGLMNAVLPLGDLQDVNYLLAPDWTQPEEVLGEAIAQVFRQLAQQETTVTLAFYGNNADLETINLLLSGIAFELMMGEGLALDEKITPTVVNMLSSPQWNLLLPRLQGRLILDCDDQEAIATFPDGLTAIKLTTE